MPSAVCIREARASDASAIAAVRAQSLGVGSETLVSRFQSELDQNAGTAHWQMFVATANDAIVGYGRCQYYDAQHHASLYETQEKLPTGWYLRGVVVANEFQRHGIASLLTQARLAWLRSRTSEIHVFLDSDEKVSIPMYLQAGFKEISKSWKFQDATRTEEGILLVHESEHSKPRSLPTI